MTRHNTHARAVAPRARVAAIPRAAALPRVDAGLLPQLLAGAVALMAALMLFATAARAATDVQEIESPEGVAAWFVESPTIPMVALEIRIPGGISVEPEDQAGVTQFLAALMTQGAGDLDAAAFSARAEELALRLSVSANRDSVAISARMLTENLDESLELIRLVLTEPRFDDEAVARVRAGMIASIAASRQSPNWKAEMAWREALFPDDPYGRPSDGSAESVAALALDDLRDALARAIHRDGPAIGVVGDLRPDAVGPMLDRLLSGLPAEAPVEPPQVELRGDRGVSVVPHPAPQSVLRMVTEGVAREDDDFMPAFVMNHILGGGGFTSRLMQEVRVKRGLTYGVFSQLALPDRAPLMVVGLAAANARVAEALEAVRAEFEDVRENGVTEAELEAAQRYLTGAWPLNFDSNAKIAGQLAGLMADGLTPAYLVERNAMVEAVTVDDVARTARRLLRPEAFKVVVVGQPEGFDASN